MTTGENYKAQELFQMAAKGIFTDQFLAQRILTYPHDNNQAKAYINYYLKVIHLFELHKALDCAINLANTALSVTTADDPLAVSDTIPLRFLVLFVCIVSRPLSTRSSSNTTWP